MSTQIRQNSLPRQTLTSTSANNNNDNLNNSKKDAIVTRGKFGKSSGSRNFNGGHSRSKHLSKNTIEAEGSNPRRSSKQNHAYSGFNKGQPNQRSAMAGSVSYQRDSIMMEADEFEVGSIQNAGSKKQSLTHLINFEMAPRDDGNDRRRGVNSNRKSHKTHSNIVSPNKYTKEEFLLVNCNFVVKQGIDLSVHLVDPDIFVDWDIVEEIALRSNEEPNCPICLYPPKAAKIARCGHVFCWPCILHYLALSDNTWRKCPICNESISRNDLKSLVSVVHSTLTTGGQVEMQLMRRERDSLFAVPVKQYNPIIEGKHPKMNKMKFPYSKITVASPKAVIYNIIARERSQLLTQRIIDEHEPEVCFIDEALGYLDDREKSLFKEVTNFDEPIPMVTHKIQEEEKFNYACSLKPKAIEEKPNLDFNYELKDGGWHVSSSSDGSNGVEIEDILDEPWSPDDLDISDIQPANNDKKNGRKDTFYFYQSSDGQKIFLHALNVQMLVAQYGSLEKCPPTIKGRILEKDSLIMTKDIRNRLRYLKHISVCSHFEVCELDLQTNLISKSVRKAFADQIDFRRRRRAKRAREEKRRVKRIQIQENRVMGKYPEAIIKIESDFHFPKVGSDSNNELSFDNSPNDDNSASGLSFARMVRTQAKKKPSSYVSSVSNSVPVIPVNKNNNNSDSEPEPEGYVPPPPQASIGESLALALEKATLQQFDENKNGNGKKSGGKKGKKMKGTKILLTGGPRPEF